MKRRTFITGLGGVAVWPVVARAQQPTMPVVGFLYIGAPEQSAYVAAAFRKGLSETGFLEGQNAAIEYRWAHNDMARLPELVADLVRRRVAVIAIPGSAAAASAAKRATATIPIVFGAGGDPVQLGLVASFNRPGGNVTGISSLSLELGAKRLGLLRELIPGAVRFAALVDPNNPPTEAMVTDLQAAASAIGRQIEFFNANSNREIDAAFASMVQRRIEALVVGSSVVFTNRRLQLIALATHYRLPAMYAERLWAEAGGLMAYGSSTLDEYRQVGLYTGRILKGAKPADLPVVQSTKFELVINLTTARTLGIAIPETLLATADEVIQ